MHAVVHTHTHTHANFNTPPRSHTDICNTHSHFRTVYPQMDGSVLDDSSPLPPLLSDITYQPSLLMEEKETISPYLTFLPFPRFHSLFLCLSVPTRPPPSAGSFVVISRFHTVLLFFCLCRRFFFICPCW